MKNDFKIMVLGASYLQSFIIKKIQEMRGKAIALDGNPECESKDLADKFYHCNIVDKEGVLKIAKEEGIDGIMTYASDVAAPVVSYVAEELGLPANPLKSVTILTDKGLTRKFMEEHGFNVPKSQQVLTLDEAKNAANRIGYPVFLKPVDSNGSKGCSKVSSGNGLEEAFKYAQSNSRTKRVIVEKFIVRKGYQIDADCFMYNGELVFFHPMDQHQDPLAPYSPIGISAPSVQSKEKSDIAFNEVRRLLQLLNMRFGEYNVEYVFDENDNLYIIEIGPRSGGNLIPDVILESAGLDLRELNIKATLGEDISSFPFNEYHFTSNVTSFIIHSQETGTFKGVEIDEKLKESILFQHMFIKEGTEAHKFTGGIYALGFALVKFDTQKEMLEFIDNSSKYYKIIVK